MVVRSYTRRLRECECITAGTFKEARAAFRKHRRVIDLIIMDGEIPGTATTIPFARSIRRQKYGGPIIAASGQPSLNEQLLKAGCTAKIEGLKGEAIQMARQILRLP